MAVTPARALVELGVDEQHAGPRVLDDVLDLFGVEAEVDGHEDPAEPADPEERDEEPGGVRADDGDPLPLLNPHAIECSGHGYGRGGGAGCR